MTMFSCTESEIMKADPWSRRIHSFSEQKISFSHLYLILNLQKHWSVWLLIITKRLYLYVLWNHNSHSDVIYMIYKVKANQIRRSHRIISPSTISSAWWLL